MKKIVVFVLGLLFLASAYGQDTVAESDPYYLFWPHTQTLLGPWDFIPTIGNAGSGGHSYWGYHASPGTLVYGVAIRGKIPLDSVVNFSIAVREIDTTYIHFDTVYLDSSAVHCYIKYEARQPPYQSNPPEEHVEDCYEVYFHQPWAVPETFFVVNRFAMDTCKLLEKITLSLDYNEILQPVAFWENGRFTTVGENQYYDYFLGGTRDWGEVFPIIQPERLRCDKPTGLHIVGRGTGWFTVGWDGGGSAGYRVTLEAPDDTMVSETTDTTMTFSDLAAGSLYWVEVQRLCHHVCNMHDTVFASDEGQRLGIRISANGIAEGTNVPRMTVAPNPAHDHVKVNCAEGLESVEVYDMQGRRMIALQTSGTTADINLTILPQGNYILLIHSPAGSLSKPLTVH